MIIIICDQKCWYIKVWTTEIFPTLKIIPVISQARFQREFSGLPFAYSLYAVLFFICTKMTIDLLENFQSKTC